MQPSQRNLSKYRLERAEEDIQTARINIENGLYKGAINRSYYAIFHSIRAVNVLDGFDASKHSSVIAHFNQYHVHTGDFDKEIYKIIDSAYRIREKCDYSDFFIVTKEEAQEQYGKAIEFLRRVREFLN
ncbi:MAG: HEPN domain-containing protein [Roseburia sp.]|nr:HEPN domain-containing protein [Roseburia sp.]MCM1279819.1 HEPN domain-containing protein [Robinsoniella sp.]